MLQSNLSWGGRSHGAVFFLPKFPPQPLWTGATFMWKRARSARMWQSRVLTRSRKLVHGGYLRERERKMESCLCKVNSKAMKGFENARNRKKKCQRLSHRGGVISGSLRLLLTLCVLEPVQRQKPFTLILTSMDNLDISSSNVHVCMSVGELTECLGDIHLKSTQVGSGCCCDVTVPPPLLCLCDIFQSLFPFTVTANHVMIIDRPAEKIAFFFATWFFLVPYVLSQRHRVFMTATYFLCPLKYPAETLPLHCSLPAQKPTREIHSRGVFINALTELSPSVSLPHPSACNANTAEFDYWLPDLFL